MMAVGVRGWDSCCNGKVTYQVLLRRDDIIRSCERLAGASAESGDRATIVLVFFFFLSFLESIVCTEVETARGNRVKKRG